MTAQNSPDLGTACRLASFEEALSCQQRGDLARADDICRELLQAQPAHGDSWHLRGLIAFARGEFERGIELVQQSLACQPNQPAALANIGTALLELRRAGEALAHFDHALALQPGSAATFYGRGCALLELGRPAEALVEFDRALHLTPELVVAHDARGRALQQLQCFEEALQAYARALSIQPGFAAGHFGRGHVFLDMQQPDAALASFDRALLRSPEWAEALHGRGIALTRLRRPEEAASAFTRCLTQRPDLPYARGQALHALAQQANWRRHEELTATVLEANARGQPADEPFSFLAISGSAEAQLRCARTYAADWYPARLPPLWAGQRHEHDRIRVAYLSADFGDHPTSYLMAGVFEQHARERFEAIGLSLQPLGAGHYSRRIRTAFDRFLELADHTDDSIARLIRELEVDLVIDLMGHTRGTRLGILAKRPAPVQVSYLGYPGTTAAPYIDYLIADPFVIPPSQRPYYSERIAYLPDCFQANDDRRFLPEAPARAQVGLPETGFVFCAFNASYKITPGMFDVWCRLLRAVPGSVLWLLGERESTRANLEREAHARGVAAQRLIFAERLDYERHLARLRLADLFLDTSPFNAGASASDALWAGVPVLTCPGEGLAARMAGSLLQTVGLPELICRSMEDYEQHALGLAGDPSRLATIRAGLWRNRTRTPLFDTRRFCRHLECAYAEMHERARLGDPAVDIYIEPSEERPAPRGTTGLGGPIG